MERGRVLSVCILAVGGDGPSSIEARLR